MAFTLGINTGFAVNRYSEPEVWTDIVGGQLGIRAVQVTADILNPDLPVEILSNHTSRIVKGLEHHGSQVTSTFTGALTRVNHLAHPDPEIRRHWVKWFCRFVDLSVDLGAEACHGFIHGVIQYLVDQVVETPLVGAPNVHSRADTHRFQALQDLDIFGCIFACLGLRHVVISPLVFVGSTRRNPHSHVRDKQRVIKLLRLDILYQI